MKIYCEIDFHIFPIMKTIRLSLSLSLSLRLSLCFVLEIFDHFYANEELVLFWLATGDNGCLL